MSVGSEILGFWDFLALRGHNEGVVTLNEPQIWMLIGVFGASMVGMMTLVSSTFVRVLRAEIGAVRGEIGSLRHEIDSLRHELRTEIARVEQVLSTRIDHLDRDVQVLMRRVFDDPAA